MQKTILEISVSFFNEVSTDMQKLSSDAYIETCELPFFIGFLQGKMQLLFSGKVLLPSVFRNSSQ
jgi:hypothetical protein